MESKWRNIQDAPTWKWILVKVCQTSINKGLQPYQVVKFENECKMWCNDYGCWSRQHHPFSGWQEIEED